MKHRKTQEELTADYLKETYGLDPSDIGLSSCKYLTAEDIDEIAEKYDLVPLSSGLAFYYA